jgi:acyl dehydratase
VILQKGENMPISSQAVGSTTTLPITEISARRIIAYAAGLGDTNPRYLDDAAAAGIVAHPAFCVALEWPAAVALREQSPLGGTADEKLRAVHAAQDSTWHRPIRPGDWLRTMATVLQVRTIKPGALVLTKFATADADTGELVVTSYSSTIYRGVGVTGEDAQSEAAPVILTTPEGLAPHIGVDMPIAREAPHVYTECAQIWNPIHTERRVALQAGLPDIILHGTATWALAASQLIQRCAHGDPTRLRRFAGRFTAMVIPGTTIRLAYTTMPDEPQTVFYSVYNADGATAISSGLAVIEP